MKKDGFIFNAPRLLDYRRLLRKNETDAERKLWRVLRNKQCRLLKFYRQYSVGDYILDFYCPKVRVGIELDGGQHNELDHIQHDRCRTADLQQRQITIIRFWNNEVLNNIEVVYDTILHHVDKRLITPPNLPLF